MNAHEALDRIAALHLRDLTPAQAVEEAVLIYLELGAEIEALDAARAAAKQVIGDVMVETGSLRFETNAGMAYLANPSLRVSYDAKGIEAMIVHRPDLAEALAPHRIEKMIPGALTVRAKGGSK